MIKSIVAAGTIAIALFGLQLSAQAGGLGVGLGGTGHHGNKLSRYDAQDDALPRWRVLKKLERRGYRGFHGLRRNGQVYKVRAHRHGRVFKIWVNAYTGNIVKRRRVA